MPLTYAHRCIQCALVLLPKAERCPRCGAPVAVLRDPDDPLVGCVVGRWVVTQHHGQGGMGVVYRGVHPDPQLSYPVMVKFNQPHISPSNDAPLRFRREAQVVARLNHDNIVRLLDFDTLPTGQGFLVMEFLEGASLAELLPAQGMSLPRAIDLLIQITDGLRHAHRSSVVHRDLHTNNIMVVQQEGRGEVCKIIDFGLARAAHEEALPSSSAIRGAPPFMAPEVWIEGLLKMAPSYDLYAFGCVIHDVVTGQPPFAGTMERLIHQHLHDAPPRLGQRRPGVPAALERLTAQLLDKDPTRRPTAEEVGQVLRQIRDRLVDRPAPTIHDLETVMLDRVGPRCNDELETLLVDAQGRVLLADGDATTPMDVEGCVALMVEVELERQERQMGRLLGRLSVWLGAARLLALTPQEEEMERLQVELSLARDAVTERRAARERSEEVVWAQRMAGHEQALPVQEGEAARRAEALAVMSFEALRRQLLRLQWGRLRDVLTLTHEALAMPALREGERAYIDQLARDLREAKELLDRWLRK